MKLAGWWLMLSGAIFFAGCDSKPEPEPAPPPPQAPKPQPFTTGSVMIVDLPGDDGSPVEVILLPEIPASVLQLIEEQHALHSAAFAPGAEDATDALEVSIDDTQKIEAELKRLASELPTPRTTPLPFNGATRDFVSSQDQHAKYARFVAALDAGNLLRGITHINERLKEDYEALQAHMAELEAEGERAEENFLQAQADINWLASFSQYFRQYEAVLSQYDEMRSQFLEASGGIPPPKNAREAWQQYQLTSTRPLEIEVYKHSLDSVVAEAGGEFKLDGTGKIIVGLKIEGHSLFLIPAGPGGQYLWLDYSQHDGLVKEPSLKDSAATGS